jgi:hypothetical protein
MKKIIVFFALIIFKNAIAQTTPIVYINFVSHNEPADTLDKQYGLNKMNTKVLQLASIIQSKNAAWNLQTCDGYAIGALTYQGKNSNVFKTLATTYSVNIEIDPRYKVSFPRNSSNWNIADTYHILDSLGANPTQTLGGFVVNTSSVTVAPIDWFPYQDTIIGKTYNKIKWKSNLMWGAGSYRPHTSDINDWGIFKPDTVSYTTTQESFLKHNPNRKLWYIGNGCQPIYALDSNEDENMILDNLRSFLNDIENNVVPQNKFYVYSITINQSGFGPTLYNKISKICDTVNAWGTNKIQWKKLSEKFALFEDWQISSGLDYSQWLCGQTSENNTSTSLQNSTNTSLMQIFPNPVSDLCNVSFSDSNVHDITLTNVLGNVILNEKNVQHQSSINLKEVPMGIYFITVDNYITSKIFKQ